MLKEFKKFILRGNVIDLAVGVMIGAAFQNIVNSVVKNLFTPLISLITGKINLENLFVSLDGNAYASLAAAQAAEAATFNYGMFIQDVINFFIMAVCIFLIVKGINTVRELFEKKNTEIPAQTTKKCPYCLGVVDIKATKCMHCTSELE